MNGEKGVQAWYIPLPTVIQPLGVHKFIYLVREMSVLKANSEMDACSVVAAFCNYQPN